MRISRISLYDCAENPHVSMYDIASFMQDMFGILPCIMPPPRLDVYNLNACKVRSIFRPPDRWTDSDTDDIDLYDGHLLADILGAHLSHTDGTYHILFVNHMVGTYDISDMRYHGRAVISSNPAIISIRGICEAPARPRSYYIDMACTAGGDPNVNARYAGSFIMPDDPRLEYAACGYVMQAVFHFETGEAFCSDTNCRLFNSHWQSDVIRTQVESPNLCRHHQSVLYDMR